MEKTRGDRMKFKLGDVFLTTKGYHATVGEEVTPSKYKINWNTGDVINVSKTEINRWIEKRWWIKLKYIDTPLWRKLEGEE